MNDIEQLKFISDVAEIIYNTNYIYWDVKKEQTKSDLLVKIKKRFTEQKAFSALQAYDMVKDFCYEERQAKLIANSVRVYEYFGYDWYMPFWDSGVVEAWHITSKEQADRRGIYYLTINELCPGCIEITRPVGHENEVGTEITRGFIRKAIDTYAPGLYQMLRSFRQQKDNLNLWGYLSLKDCIYGAVKGQKFADAMWVHNFVLRCVKEKND